MRFDIHPNDRVHMAVWRRYRDPHWWCAARCLNGIPLEHAAHFPSWREALDYAIAQLNGIPLEHAAHFSAWREALDYAIAQINK